MTILDWPQAERPREKLLARGSSALSDAELLALFLGTGRRGQSAVDLGRELLRTHGNLKALLDLEPVALAALPGLGDAKACRLAAAIELGRRCLAQELERPDALSDPAACGTFLRARLAGYPHEVFACLFLDLCSADGYVEPDAPERSLVGFGTCELHITLAFRVDATNRRHRCDRRARREAVAVRPGTPVRALGASDPYRHARNPVSC